MKLSFNETVYELKPKSIQKQNKDGIEIFTEDLQIFENGIQLKGWLIQKETILISDIVDGFWIRVKKTYFPFEKTFERKNEEITLSDFINILNVMRKINLDKRLF